ncbi:methyltransferase [Shinella sumterensis]|nr:methyltransferase [Shinella sumterensis]
MEFRMSALSPLSGHAAGGRACHRRPRRAVCSPCPALYGRLLAHRLGGRPVRRHRGYRAVRRSRNPVFVGQVALFAGFVVARPDIVQLALAAAVVAAVWLQVRVEEKVLERDLGEPYAAYRERVRRWL